jgi:membrane protease YdiL (CAAX protease family)
VIIVYTRFWFFPADVNPQQDLFFPSGATWASTIGGMLSIGILVPFAEELLFRGVIYRFIRERWGIWIGVIISAAVFGIAHWDPIVSLNAGLGGIVYALVYERTKSLWPSIIMHSVGNLLADVFVVYTLLSTHTKMPWL